MTGWTAELVLAAHVRTFRRMPALHASRGRLLAAGPCQSPWTIFAASLIEISEAVLDGSPERVALLIRAENLAKGRSTREQCREGYRWHASRRALYRRSNRGAERLAAALNARGVEPQ